jgi:ribosomal protein S12 methylthiotransferase
LHYHKKRFYLLSLGCPKNDVDSDVFTSRLVQAGWRQVKKPVEAELLMVNTCSFITSAVEETVEAILEISDYKEGKDRKLVVTGCLVARYGAETLSSLLPEVDLFVDFSDYQLILPLMERVLSFGMEEIEVGPNREYSSTLGKGYVHIKISEGCRRKCAYCAIPGIRGPLESRTWEDICDEGSFFLKNGARELVLVAQDTTSYGVDLYGTPSLALLLDHLMELDGDYRLRIMYMHPQGVDQEILRSMRNSKICPYLDIPLQHVDPAILKSMGRKGGRKEFGFLINSIRDALTEVALRSTFMVGFPGEDRTSFQKLHDFIAETRFDWLGLFSYSQEEGTPAYHLGGGVPAAVVRGRLKALAELQEEIMREKAHDLIGNRYRVLVEGRSSEAPGYWESRSCREAPEIDGIIFLPDDSRLHPGIFCEVEISGNEGIDLFGIPKTQNKEIR